MTPMRKHLIATLLASAALGAVAQVPAAAPAAAQPGVSAAGPQEHGGRHGRAGRDGSRMREHMAKRQAALKQKLQITAAQEAAWTRWTESMQPTAKRQRPDREEFARLSTPERIDRMRALRTQRAAEMDRRGEATKVFYASLGAEQKKVFDEETARFGRKAGRHGGRHGGEGRQGGGQQQRGG